MGNVADGVMAFLRDDMKMGAFTLISAGVSYIFGLVIFIIGMLHMFSNVPLDTSIQIIKMIFPVMLVVVMGTFSVQGISCILNREWIFSMLFISVAVVMGGLLIAWVGVV